VLHPAGGGFQTLQSMENGCSVRLQIGERGADKNR
jgi:hypothetical protein